MFDWTFIITSFCGGVFAAAVGGLPIWIFTGFLGLFGIAAGIAGSTFDWNGVITFGSCLGPQITFAAGVATASYARKIGCLNSGKDISTSLIGCNNSSILLVGGLFGIEGYLVNIVLASFLGNGQTDTIALTIVIVHLTAKVIFGEHGVKEIFGVLSEEAKARGRFTMGGSNRWLPWQETMSQKVMLAIGVGGFSAMITKAMLADPKTAPYAVIFELCFSAATLVFLQTGQKAPITHHLSVISAIAVVATGDIFWGIAMAIIASQLRDIGARLFYIHGDTHVDPPAFAICTGTTLSYILVKLGIYRIGGNVLPIAIILIFAVWSIVDSKQRSVKVDMIKPINS